MGHSARRRADLDRVKAKADRKGKEAGLPGNWDHLYDHMAECSGPCCGNPRKWFGELTVAEVRAIDDEVEYFAEQRGA